MAAARRIANDGRSAAYAAFFDVFANDNRWRIIQALREGPKSVTELTMATGMEQTCTSHCLRKLAAHGFVSVQRRGKFRMYSLNDRTVEPILQLVEREL